MSRGFYAKARIGLFIGGISGKGMAAALLMANLQANLRSQCAIAIDQPQQFLRSANQLFFDNTADSSYATFILCRIRPDNAAPGVLQLRAFAGAAAAKREQGDDITAIAAKCHA